MTIVFRNTTVTIGIVVSFLIVTGVTLFTLFFLPTIIQGAEQAGLSPLSIVVNFVTIFSLGLFSLVSAIILRISFDKTLAPELFFFTMFIITFSFEMFRMAPPFFLNANYPFFYGIIVTKAVYFSRFLRVFTAFISGIFACSVTNPRTGIYLGIGLLLSLAFAAGIPVDATEMGVDFLYAAGISRYILIVFIIVEVLSTINFVLAGVLKNTREFFFMSAALGITLIGSRVIVSLTDPFFLPVIGFLLLILGTILFGKRTHDLYLWV